MLFFGKGGKKRVLVIDDEPLILETLDAWLKMQGYTAFTAPDPVSGVEMAAKKQPDLIILDNYMGSLSGFDALAKLRSDPKTSKTPVIMMSGFDKSIATVEAAFKAGANAFIPKPPDFERLKQKIVSLLSNQGLS